MAENKYNITGALSTPSPNLYADPYTDKKVELYGFDKKHWAQNMQMSQELNAAAQTQTFMPRDESTGREHFTQGISNPLENFYETGAWNRADFAINESIRFATSDPKLMQFKRNSTEYAAYQALKNSPSGQQFGLINFGQNPDEFETVTYDDDSGEEILNVFRNEAEIRLDKTTRKLNVIGNIAEAGESPYFDKEGIDIDGDDIVDYLAYGQTGGGVSQSRINSVVDAVYQEYRETPEGRQEFRELTELQGMSEEDAKNSIVNSMRGLAQKQYKAGSTTATYVDQFAGGKTSRQYADDVKTAPDDVLTRMLATSQQGDGTFGITNPTFAAFFTANDWSEDLGGYLVGDNGEGLLTNLARDYNMMDNFDVNDLPQVVKTDILEGSLVGLSDEKIMTKLIDWYATLDPASQQKERNAKLTNELFGDIIDTYNNPENASIGLTPENVYMGEGMSNDESYPEGIKTYYEKIVKDYFFQKSNLDAESLGALMNPALKSGAAFRKTGDKAEVMVDEGGTYLIIPGEYAITEDALNSNAAQAGLGETGGRFLVGDWGATDIDNIKLPDGTSFVRASTNDKGEAIYLIKGYHKQLVSNDMGDRLNKEIYTDKANETYSKHWSNQRAHNKNVADRIAVEHNSIDQGRLTYRVPGENQVGDIDITNAGSGIKQSIKDIQTQSQAIFALGNPFLDNTGQYVALGDRNFTSFDHFMTSINAEIADILVNQAQFDRKEAGVLLGEFLRELRSADYKWKK